MQFAIRHAAPAALVAALLGACSSPSHSPAPLEKAQLPAPVAATPIVAETPAAAPAHASQAAVRDYVAYARGLNAYRAMTMPPEVKFAEGYYVVDLPSLRTMSVAALQHAIGDARSIEVVSETIPISVITNDMRAVNNSAPSVARIN